MTERKTGKSTAPPHLPTGCSAIKRSAATVKRLNPALMSPAHGFSSRGEDWKNAAFLRHAEQLMHMGSWQVDLRTGKCTWSKGLYKITGIPQKRQVTAEEFLGMIHPADRGVIAPDAERAIQSHSHFQHEYRIVLSDGEVRTIRSRGEAVYDRSGSAVELMGVWRDITEQKRQADQRRANGETLSRQLMQTRDDDRRRLARQLHETVGQSLAALRMTLGQLAGLLSTENAELKTLLQAANQLADDSIRETRTISYVMHPPLLDEAGLEPALQWYLRGFAQRSGISVESDIQSGVGRFPREIETGVFRVVQEALTNVHRHSGARSAKVAVRKSASHLMAEISDSGRGLPRLRSAEYWGSPPGVGIAGMRERVVLLHGEFEIASKPGEGTRVRVALPTSIGSAATGKNGSQIKNETEAKGRKRTAVATGR